MQIPISWITVTNPFPFHLFSEYSLTIIIGVHLIGLSASGILTENWCEWISSILNSEVVDK